MPGTKIVNEQEVLDWFAEGRTYQWMVDEYRRKYGVETATSMWGNFRRRQGIETRIVRDDDLIPWAVRQEHRWSFPVLMLRSEARKREGKELTDTYAAKLKSWLEYLSTNDVVVHYDPDTEEGFFYVPRLPTDTDIVRKPTSKTGRPNAD